MRKIQGREIKVNGTFAFAGNATILVNEQDVGIDMGKHSGGELHNILIKRTHRTRDEVLIMSFHKINFTYTGKYAEYKDFHYQVIEKPQRKRYTVKHKVNKSPTRAVKL